MRRRIQQIVAAGRWGSIHWLWLGPLLYMVFLGLYFVVRFDGLWAEADSTTFTIVLRNFIEQARLEPVLGPVYPNGFSYQAISSFVVTVTGLQVEVLQQLVYPLMVVIIVLPAWVLYREFTGSPRGAAVATILLFTQPEFLFVVLRSSHEKFTRLLMLLCLFLLVRSLNRNDKPYLLAVQVALFYLAAFALITSNNLLAHSFIFAIFVALVLGRLLARRRADLQRRVGHTLQRLQYVVLTSLGLVYLVTFFAYPPAQHEFLVLQDVWERLATMFLDVQTRAATGTYTEAYQAVVIGWVSLPTYLMVSIANWVILLSSLAIWLHQGYAWFFRRQTPRTQGAFLLWLLYAAFAAQGALSVLVDASGALSSNLQHRLFPSFSIFAVAIVGAALARWRPRRFARPIGVALATSIFCIVILSTFKASNDPLVSNKWTFHRASELAALDWSTAHLEGVDIWTEYDERLVVAYVNARGEPANENRLHGYRVLTTTRDILVSDVTRLRSTRLGAPLPMPPDALLVYDNGETEFYHLRPQTPYQR